MNAHEAFNIIRFGARFHRSQKSVKNSEHLEKPSKENIAVAVATSEKPAQFVEEDKSIDETKARPKKRRKIKKSSDTKRIKLDRQKAREEEVLLFQII